MIHNMDHHRSISVRSVNEADPARVKDYKHLSEPTRRYIVAGSLRNGRVEQRLTIRERVSGKQANATIR